MITRILSTVNIDAQGEKSISSNRIDYTSLKDIKIDIKYEELRDDWTIKEDDTEETSTIDINQVWEIF